MGPPSGTVTFLFTDIEGSTRLWEEQPDVMRAAVARHDELFRAVIEANKGYIFATGGDGFAAAFARPPDAVAAAESAQAALRAEAWPEAVVLKVRMGLHTGVVEERDGDYFGSAVNRAARLMAAGHGGQVLVSAATAALLGTAGLVDLGVHRLRDLAEAQRVFQLGSGRLPALRTLDVAPSNLPLQATDLVGRRLLIEEVAGLLAQSRAVTLTGVGGVGKTRLAIEVGAEVLPKFPDGVWLVDLAPVAHDEMVLPTVADTLGVSAQSGEPLITTVLSRLVTKRLLIVLDNCEHVIGPVARFVERVVANAPNVRALATSREALGIRGERVQPVPPLAEGTEAVELFLQHASCADPTFDPAPSRAVHEICRRLEGIPLAIELAAARARHMSAEQIAERLDQRFRLLTGGARTAIERHRTLQATVAWSYDLLDPAEKLVFQRLSVMAAPFDLQAAEAVAAGDGVEGWEVIDALGRLVDKSMVMTVRGDGELRYRLLETLRQYGAERLAESTDQTEVRDRYARYWCERARRGRTDDRSDTDPALDAVERDLDHYRAALAQLLTAGDADVCARAFLALTATWLVRHTGEALAWCEQLLNHDLSIMSRVRVLAIAAHAGGSFSPGKAPELAQEALTLAADHGLRPPWDAYLALMAVAGANGDLEAHREIWSRAADAARATGNRYVVLLTDAGRAPPGTELTPELVDHYEGLLAQLAGVDSPILKALACMSYGTSLFISGETERGLELVRAALAHAARTPPLTEAFMSANAAGVFLLAGQTTTAVSVLRRSLPMARDIGATQAVIDASAVAALIAAREGDIDAAAALASGTRHQLGNMGVAGGRPTNACLEDAEALIAPSGEDMADARSRRALMTVEDLVTAAMSVLDRQARDGNREELIPDV